MKTMKLFRLMTITAVAGIGLMLTLSNCKREKEIIVVNVHDTLRGKNITGLVTYPDYLSVIQNANGAVLNLYAGNSATGTPVATAFADQTGNYSFKFLLPGTYFITGSYNSLNQNKGLSGVTFVTTPGYVVTMASANLIQNVALGTAAPAGTLKIALTADTLSAGPGFLPVKLEGHSKISFTGMHNMNQQDLPGGFNGMVMQKFNFDEANPENIVINCYVRSGVNFTNSGATPTTGINTFEPSRDQLGTGCVSRTLLCDTMQSLTKALSVIPATDTIRFYANAGEVVKYGKGYLAHGHMKGFYHHSYGNRRPVVGGNTLGTLIPADTSWQQTAEGLPYDQYIDKPVDMYFEYQFKKLQGTVPATAKWEMVFEGTFTFNKAAWYVKSTSISDIIKVDAHIAMEGLPGRQY